MFRHTWCDISIQKGISCWFKITHWIHYDLLITPWIQGIPVLIMIFCVQFSRQSRNRSSRLATLLMRNFFAIFHTSYYIQGYFITWISCGVELKPSKSRWNLQRKMGFEVHNRKDKSFSTIYAVYLLKKWRCQVI